MSLVPLSTMSTKEDLSFLPPAVLQAALDTAKKRAAEKRVEREKEIRREIREQQKQLDEYQERTDTPSNLSSLPITILQAARDASKERIKKREEIRRKIRELQKQLEEPGEQAGTSEIDFGEKVAGGSRHKTKRSRSNSSSDVEVIEIMDTRQPIAKARKVDPGPASPQRYVGFPGGETLMMTQRI